MTMTTASDSRPIRVGVVGAGAIAQRGILPHLSQPDMAGRVVLEAVCDPAPDRAKAAAKKFNVAASYESFDTMLAKADVDIVTLCSPIGLHFEQGRAALNAGRHVHFNKTMTTTVAEADELIDLAERKNLRIVASPGEVLRPQHQHIRRLVQDGELGTICWSICGASLGRYHENEAFRQGDDALSNVDPSWYFRKPGGGPLYDMSVYALHGLTTVLGPVQSVTAMSGVRVKEREFRGTMMPTDAHDNTLMLLGFGDALHAVVYGCAAGGMTFGFYPNIYGTHGRIEGLTLNGEPMQYPGRDIVDQAPGRSGEAWVLPHVVGPHRDIGEHHVFEDVMQLVDWVRDGTPSPVTAEHARHVIDIIESAYLSAETGEARTLRTSFDAPVVEPSDAADAAAR
ncbi:MAG: Gfo/Idh/MocA family oxidoreductase [Phycisphaeraceae bacterium]